jgi:CRISPR-associated protein Cmr2
VYAGGDDLLGLVPAATALAAARECRAGFLDRCGGLLPRPTVSSAVVFFHASYPLRDALARARAALVEAKETGGRDSLAVVVLRRGGEKAAAVLPWSGRGGADPTVALEGVVDSFRTGLSPALVRDLYEGRRGLAELDRARLDYATELRRLVGRHLDGGASTEQDRDARAEAVAKGVQALEPVGSGRLTVDDVVAWVGALAIARFVAQEGR